MDCAYYQDARCRSCTELLLPYPVQLAARETAARALLDPIGNWDWLASATSPERGFRNKAKMAISGTIEAPLLGILDAVGNGTDLTACSLYPTAIQDAFAPIAAFLAQARVQPYDLRTQTGEAKYVLLTLAEHSGELMLRLVLRSRESLDRVRKASPRLHADLPGLRVLSVNLLPEHKAVTEGEIEIVLSEAQALRCQVNGLPLYLRPRSFFQTNTAVAAELYLQARAWAGNVGARSIWDLYCGVGGFALHCAHGAKSVLGIESSAEAIVSAEQSRDECAFEGVRFCVADAADPGQMPKTDPELLIVNPPRRGIGVALCRWIEGSTIRHLIYSSCNPQSLAQDLARLPGFQPREARLFDMFPHTRHSEVAVLLSRRAP